MTRDMHAIVPSHDVVLVTLDTLRYDVAVEALAAGELPVLGRYVAAWEERHTPGTFTYAAHTAFFAGFLPTPARPGAHERLFACAFPGSETAGPRTFVFDAPDIVRGFAGLGYRTICIGGTGFFNRLTPLGRELPDRFAVAHWDPELGVTNLDSPRRQVERACAELDRTPGRAFLFVNVSALHQPNREYVPGAERDGRETMRAALRAVDSALGDLVEACRARGPSFWIVCSDHGTAYGEDGYEGHRLAHPVVTTVPYADFVVEAP